MDIESFLPNYPAVDSPDFYQQIYDRQEFRELKLASSEEIPTEPGNLMPAQKIISRYLSVFTVYDRCLLVWEMGSGKTCASVGLAEAVFQHPEFGINKAIYLARSKDLVDKFQHALATNCTAGEYLPKERKITYTDQSWITTRNRLIRKRYRCETYYIFCEREIWGKTDEAIRREFSNHVFIFDEVHNLRDTGKRGKRNNTGRYTLSIGDQYNSLFRLLSAAENVKVVFLSGTPMTNSADEIGSVFRLLTGDSSIPSASAFTGEYMARNSDGIMEVRQEKLPELREIFRGRVSYLRAVNIPTEFQGERLPGFQHFVLYPDTPSDQQLTGYISAYQADTNTSQLNNLEAKSVEALDRGGVFNNTREAALLVFPDGSWGSRGYRKYIKEKSEPLLPQNPTVNDVYNLSAKYGMVLDQLLRMRSGEIPRRKIFIFCKYVNGSGLRAFGEILKKFGFVSATGNPTTVQDRFAIVTSSQEDAEKQQSTNKLISAFNKPDNVTGERIWVLMGTEKIAEGYDLYDCDICHIFTPHWNYSETEQAIARIKRMGRHAVLESYQNYPVTVKVYQHCFTVPGDNPPSIDLKMYSISEKKDIAIAKMRRLLKESAVDCQLTFSRNYRPTDTDNSRECDYTVCEYTCNGITDPNSTDINENTWQLYYADTAKIKEILCLLLRNQFTATIPEALEFIRSGFREVSGTYVTLHALLRVVSDFIDSAEPIIDMYGFVGYLAVETDRLFLTPNPFGKSYSTDTTYLSEISVEAPVDIPQYITPDIYLQLLKTKTLTKNRRKELLAMLSPSARETLLQDVVLSHRDNPTMNIPGREALYQIFEEFITVEPGRYISTLMYDPSTGQGAKCLNEGETTWKPCDITDSVPEAVSENDIKDNPLGFYGKIETSKGKKVFKLMRPKVSKRGRNCNTTEPEVLNHICGVLGLSCLGNRAEKCELIRTELESRGLVATAP